MSKSLSWGFLLQTKLCTLLFQNGSGIHDIWTSTKQKSSSVNPDSLTQVPHLRLPHHVVIVFCFQSFDTLTSAALPSEEHTACLICSDQLDFKPSTAHEYLIVLHSLIFWSLHYYLHIGVCWPGFTDSDSDTMYEASVLPKTKNLESYIFQSLYH